MGGQRRQAARGRTLQEGLAEQETETQRGLWALSGVAVVGETPSLTPEFVGK